MIFLIFIEMDSWNKLMGFLKRIQLHRVEVE